MVVNVWVEPYTLMMGVHMMDVMIEVLCTSGLVYAPFMVALAVSMVEAMTQGEDEGNAGELAIKFFRQKLFVMMPVFILAFVPSKNISVSYDTSAVSYTCSDTASSTSSTSSSSSTVSTSSSSVVGNFSAGENKVPIFWAWVHDYASHLTNVTIADMPCASDITMAQTVLNQSNLTSPADQQLATKWMSQCLSPAMSKYTSGTSTASTDLWAGSSDLRTIYKNLTMSDVTTDLATTAGISYSTTDTTGANVRLNCDTVYSHIESAAVTSAKSNQSLYSSLKTFFTSDDDFKRLAVEKVAKISVGNSSKSILENLSDVVDSNASSLSGLSVSGMLKTIVATVGTAVGNIMNGPGAVIERNSMPIMVCVYQMVFFGVAPILLVFSGFDITVCLSLAALYFGLEFTNTIVAMCVWTDNVLNAIFLEGGTTSIYTAFNDSGAKESVSLLQGEILQNVQYACYKILPNLWMALLAYVGAKGGASMIGNASKATDSIKAQAGDLIRKSQQKAGEYSKERAKDKAKSDAENIKNNAKSAALNRS